MSECDVTRQQMPELLAEALDFATREQSHRHIESCLDCEREWAEHKLTWMMLGDLPEVDVPARLRENFLDRVQPGRRAANVIPFHRRPAFRWAAQAAAAVILVGGSYFTGHRTATIRVNALPGTIESVRPINAPAGAITPASFSIAESRVLPASAISPDIQGRPNIDNVRFFDDNPSDDAVGVSFDMTSHVTITGKPADKSMIRLISYVLENEDRMSPSRSRAIDWVRRTYTENGTTDPEITRALENVLRNDDHEGVRIKAVDTLKSMPPALQTTAALIDALKNDPNPAVRIKAVEALANLASSGKSLDALAIDTLREKASQGDENTYIRVKAAEALAKLNP
jgi:hypothetical protein